MTIFKAIILGIIQGVAEFLPISSSAHLIVFPYLFGWEESSLAFDVALHFGTMMAVLVIFFKDWWNLFIGAIKDIKNKKKTTNGKMFWYLVVATIPAAIVGFLLDDVIENVIRNNIWLIASALAIMGMLIYLGDKWATHHYKKEKKFENLPENLKELANLRIQNPEASYQELGAMLKEPIGKSGVSHRLEKIVKIAEE